MKLELVKKEGDGSLSRRLQRKAIS